MTSCPTCGNDITKAEAEVILHALAAVQFSDELNKCIAKDLIARMMNHIQHDTMWFKEGNASVKH
jgi:hypothetical protein